MKISWPKIHENFVDNVSAPWVGMLPELGERLGITPESLQAFGVGFAPLIEFKKRTSEAWWTNPERDDEGRIVGISLREFAGNAKLTYPGSKHGLIYVVRPAYKLGTKDYQPGRQNWVRTMNAGIPCPVCGKPDGCLLSAENPADPKAVMCIRESRGAARPAGEDAGWLHIRKPEGHVTKGGPLEDSELPVLCVEGLSDAAAGRDLGFVTVGRPSNLAGMGLLRELLKGRTVLIIGENDVTTRTDGSLRYPGREGMEATFETLKNVAAVKKLLPPEGIKDLRIWKNDHGLTKEALIEYAQQHGSDIGNARMLDSKEPVKIATRWLKEEHTMDGFPILRYYKNGWYRFSGDRYEAIDETAHIRGGLYRWLQDRDYKTVGPDGTVKIEPYEADKGKINNIIDALSMDCPLQAEPPCWLDGRTQPEPRNLLVFPNGVLDVQAYLRSGTPDLLDLSPCLFTFGSMPYEFNPAAECPLWLKFLAQAFPDDPKKTMLLQEWAGYLTVPRTEQQKFMVFNGTSGSGKSTSVFALKAMLGQHNHCSPSLTGLGQTYGLAQFIGKSAAFIEDARMDRNANKFVIMERLLELTGSVHPILEVRRMQIAETPMHLFARVTIACNDLPDLPDSGGALPRRTLALCFTEKFDGDNKTPDRSLPDRLAAEAPGILNWALQGLDRLLRRGTFTIPASSEELAKKFTANASPIAQFIDSCCEVGSHLSAQDDIMYEVWRNWARDHNLSPGMRGKFQHNVCLTISTVRYITDVKDGKKIGGFTGVGLTQEAKDRYLGK